MTKTLIPPLVAPVSTDELDRYLATQRSDVQVSTSDYVDRGAALVTPSSVRQLRGLLSFLRDKASSIKDSRRLAVRIELLTVYFEETSVRPGQVLSVSLREVAFGLWYFLKGYDQIPDTLPEIGLLDDALVVEVVLRRNEHALRSHWAAKGRTWPDEA